MTYTSQALNIFNYKKKSLLYRIKLYENLPPTINSLNHDTKLSKSENYADLIHLRLGTKIFLK